MLKLLCTCILFNIYYTGETRQAKLQRVRGAMAQQSADVLVLTPLDETACRVYRPRR